MASCTAFCNGVFPHPVAKAAGDPACRIRFSSLFFLAIRTTSSAFCSEVLMTMPTSQARDRLTAALQALAEDPRYTQVLEEVQEKVDSAFTPTGKRKMARGSVWKQASDELRNAERLESELREQLAESESAHIQVERLRADLQHAQSEADGARRDAERLRRDLERKRALVEHTQSRDAASRDVERIQALRRLVEEKGLEVARATAQADDARKTFAARQSEKVQAEQRRDLALARVRDLETGAAEQQRRLREQEAEKEHLRLTNEKSRLSRIEERAKEVEALVDAIKHDEAEIATLQASLTEKNDLLQKAQESSEERCGRASRPCVGMRSSRDSAAHETRRRRHKEEESWPRSIGNKPTCSKDRQRRPRRGLPEPRCRTQIKLPGYATWIPS